MDLKEVISVAGKPGLFKIVANTKTGLIAESLIDKKRIPVYASDKISNLEDISIFGISDDVPLKSVFKMISGKENGGNCPDHKGEEKSLRSYFLEVFPEYDQERVYCSDIRKVLQWYNLLKNNDLLDFAPEQETQPADNGNEALPVPEEKEKKPRKPAAKKSPDAKSGNDAE